MIEINDALLGIWFVSWSNAADWMAGAWRTTDGGIAGRCRFRYYQDAKAFGSADEKHWYEIDRARPDGSVMSEEEFIANVSEIARDIQKDTDGEKWELLRGKSTYEQFFEQMKSLPFVHMKMLSPADCRFSMIEKGNNVTVTAIHKETGGRATATGPAGQKAKVKSQAVENLAALLYGRATQ